MEQCMPRLTLLAAALVITFGLASTAYGQSGALPDMGSSAGELLSPAEQAEYGAYTLYQLRHFGYVLEDPLIDAWLDGIGHRLAAVSDKPDQPFTFFMMRDRQINAFATLGGYVGVNSGLILTAQTEDEVAGVLAHEISHVTQNHVLRNVERARKDQIPIMIAMLGAIIAAQNSGSRDVYGNRNNGDAIQAAVMGAAGLAAQRQINYTRDSEAEADRFGIQTLYRAGYDANGMADFFERMQRATRGNSGGYQTPSYLQTHPLTTSRLSEARERAAKLQKEGVVAPAASIGTGSSLLLPGDLFLAVGNNPATPPMRMFDWARARLRVLSAATPQDAMKENKALLEAAGAHASDPLRYGQSLAQLQAGYPAAAESGLQALSERHPDNLWIALSLAECAHSAGNDTLARKRYEALLAQHHQDRPVSLSYARVLNEIGTPEAGRRAQAVLRPLLSNSTDDPLFQKTFGRASDLAGDFPRAGEAYAEAAYLNGRAEDALNQFAALLKRGDLDYVQRARIESRIAAITPEVLEMHRQGLKPENQPADGG
jgi:predicted Zn-dependent protease